MEFKADDKVTCSYFGAEVFVLKPFKSSCLEGFYFFCEGREYDFTKDGRDSNTHAHPVLTLVERPKKVKKIKLEFWVNVYDEKDLYTMHYPSKEDADRYSIMPRIACEHFERIIEIKE